ncbi:Protein of unknown function DUF1690 [Kalmanozyma brasiliensis GHG001]|uniref:Uncharacterized protein n=1 Tax=Kalmanozyma brasiliensis (strain GHG001) TaxID=1365824 RepID=V5ERH0_KALBG|nr:Protein of unknown function DUF1690 [Kalmanozyma brasiliensis GHG001]EST05518.1 Protein of unknown function DUF1690 [Kalmanozyma brasiliensis GHG001]
MGAAASKQNTAAPAAPAAEDKQASHLQFGRSLLNSLDKTSLDNVEGPDATRQAKLDTSIQAKIKSELDRLRKEEAEVRNEIQKAIEKENLARESKYTGASEGKNSNVLRQELEGLRSKIDKYNKQKDVSNYTGVKEAQEELVKCYKNNPERTLDCWKQAEAFKKAVEGAEKQFISSFG